MAMNFIVNQSLEPDDLAFIDQVAGYREEILASGVPGPDQNGSPLALPVHDAIATLNPRLIDPRLRELPFVNVRPVMPPGFAVLPPAGRLAYYVSPPNDWSMIKQGATLCWDASQVNQRADKQNGAIELRACDDGSNGVDEADAAIGTLVNVPAGQDADAYFSWLLSTRLTWRFPQPNTGRHATAVVTVYWELWEWANGQQAAKLNWNNANSDSYTFTDQQRPLSGNRTEQTPQPGTESNRITRIPIPRSDREKKYLAVLGLYMNLTTTAPASVETRLITTTWA